jgi:hypothetical protein
VMFRPLACSTPIMSMYKSVGGCIRAHVCVRVGVWTGGGGVRDGVPRHQANSYTGIARQQYHGHISCTMNATTPHISMHMHVHMHTRTPIAHTSTVVRKLFVRNVGYLVRPCTKHPSRRTAGLDKVEWVPLLSTHLQVGAMQASTSFRSIVNGTGGHTHILLPILRHQYTLQHILNCSSNVTTTAPVNSHQPKQQHQTCIPPLVLAPKQEPTHAAVAPAATSPDGPSTVMYLSRWSPKHTFL